MNDQGKQDALKSVEGLYPGGGTNIWAGLKSGLDILHQSKNQSAGTTLHKNSALLLLTDGIPSENPPNGHIAALKDYCESIGGKYPGIISTFGFGYNSDSILLKTLAYEGGGMYSFIPDSGFVGTAFINSLANIFTTFTIDARLTIEPTDDNCRIVSKSFIGCRYPRGEESWGNWVIIGSMQIEQQIDIIFKVIHPKNKVDNFITARLEFASLSNNLTGTTSNTGNNNSSKNIYELQGPNLSNSTSPRLSSLYYHEISSQVFRLQAVELFDKILEIMQNFDKPTTLNRVNEFIDVMNKWLEEHENDNLEEIYEQWVTKGKAERNHEPLVRIKALRKDLSGQVTEAISKNDWYMKWGRHYIPSLQRAHTLQQSNNFKDPGIQFYGGALFRQVQNDASDTFDRIPMPVMRLPNERSNNQHATGTVGTSFNMAALNNANAGCFHGDGLTRLADGHKKKVKDLKKGDVLQCGKTEFGRVLCIVETKCNDKEPIEVIKFNSGLIITPWHPIQNIMGKWEFPNELQDGEQIEIKCSSLFSLVMERLEPWKDPTLGITNEETLQEYFNLGISVEDMLRHTLIKPSNELLKDPSFKGIIGIASDEMMKDSDCGITIDEVLKDPFLATAYYGKSFTLLYNEP